MWCKHGPGSLNTKVPNFQECRRRRREGETEESQIVVLLQDSNICVLWCLLQCVLQCLLQCVLQCLFQCVLQCLLQCVLQCIIRHMSRNTATYAATRRKKEESQIVVLIRLSIWDYYSNQYLSPGWGEGNFRRTIVAGVSWRIQQQMSTRVLVLLLIPH